MVSHSGDEWVYGVHAVMGLLKTDPARVHEIRMARRRGDQRLERIRALADARTVPWAWSGRTELDALAPGRHQGVAARVSPGAT